MLAIIVTDLVLRSIGSSDPQPPTDTESAPPRPLAGDPTPPSPKQAEAPRPQGQEGAPEPPRSGVEGDPITISDGSGGVGTSRDARPADEEAQTSLVARQTPLPTRLRSIEEQKEKEQEEREQETHRQLQKQDRQQEL